MKNHLFVLLACLLVVMIGFGITLPVLPFYVERLALEAGAWYGSLFDSSGGHIRQPLKFSIT